MNVLLFCSTYFLCLIYMKKCITEMSLIRANMILQVWFLLIIFYGFWSILYFLRGFRLISTIIAINNTADYLGLGPGTLVGSAAFDLFPIHAVCVVAPKAGELKKIADLGVWLVELFWSFWAYIWFYIILEVTCKHTIVQNYFWETLTYENSRERDRELMRLFLTLMVSRLDSVVSWVMSISAFVSS